jgi:hypothetical protein
MATELNGVSRPEDKVLQHLGISREAIIATCERLNIRPAAVPATKPDKRVLSKSIKKPTLARDHVG